MKILFSDLDGTLLNNQSVVSENTRVFLDEFIDAGNRLVLSSGRPLNSILEVKEAAGLTQPGIFIIAYNGALIYDCDNKSAILEKRLPLSYVSYLQSQAKEQELHIQTYTDDSIVNNAEDAEVRLYRTKIHLPLIIADDYASFLEKGPFKMLAISRCHSRLTYFCDTIRDWASDKVQHIFSNDNYLELVVKDAGKGNAVRYVCDYFNVPISDTYAAGDAENDISMLKAAGCGIAMLNAAPKVKEAADVITANDNDNDGLITYLKTVI